MLVSGCTELAGKLGSLTLQNIEIDDLIETRIKITVVTQKR